MKVELNGWIVLLIVSALVLGYIFAFVNMKMFEPAMTAQIAGNRALVQVIDRNFTKYDQSIKATIADFDKRLRAVEAKK